MLKNTWLIILIFGQLVKTSSKQKQQQNNNNSNNNLNNNNNKNTNNNNNNNNYFPDKHKLLWDFDIQTDHLISANDQA